MEISIKNRAEIERLSHKPNIYRDSSILWLETRIINGLQIVVGVGLAPTRFVLHNTYNKPIIDRSGRCKTCPYSMRQGFFHSPALAGFRDWQPNLVWPLDFWFGETYIIDMSYENLSRKLFWRPNTVPLCGVLLPILLLFFIIPPGGHCIPVVSLPEAENYSYELRKTDPCPVVFIIVDGRVVFDEQYITDLGKLSKMIEYKLEEEQNPYCKRIHLKIHKDVPFGRVQEVLRIIKKDGYECAGLLVDRPQVEE